MQPSGNRILGAAPLSKSAFLFGLEAEARTVEVYSQRAHIIGYRTVSTDKGSYVEFTIAW